MLLVVESRQAQPSGKRKSVVINENLLSLIFVFDTLSCESFKRAVYLGLTTMLKHDYLEISWHEHGVSYSQFYVYEVFLKKL